VREGNIVITGNTVIDALLWVREKYRMRGKNIKSWIPLTLLRRLYSSQVIGGKISGRISLTYARH
jgi:hypothetical protein